MRRTTSRRVRRGIVATATSFAALAGPAMADVTSENESDPELLQLDSDGMKDPLGADIMATPTFDLRHEVSLVPQPPGYMTNSCYSENVSGAKRYECRMAHSTTANFSYSYSQIVSVSASHPTYGSMITLKNGDVYEGCKDTGSDYQCDWWTYNHWGKTLNQNGGYYWNGLKLTASQLSCSMNLAKLYLGQYLDWNAFVNSCVPITF